MGDLWIAIVFLVVGVGLLVYYFVRGREAPRDKESLTQRGM